MRIGMKRPDVFASAYLLSPCCLAPRLGGDGGSEMAARTEAITTIEEFDEADFGTRATFASAAVWAPNPNNPPFFLDLPTKDDEPQPRVLAWFAANTPLAMVDQYIPNLERLAGLAFDAGDEDRGIVASIGELHDILNVYGMPHEFEIYDGDHLSGHRRAQAHHGTAVLLAGRSRSNPDRRKPQACRCRAKTAGGGRRAGRRLSSRTGITEREAALAS